MLNNEDRFAIKDHEAIERPTHLDFNELDHKINFCILSPYKAVCNLL